MSTVNRRKFLAASGLAVLPALIPFTPAYSKDAVTHRNAPNKPTVKFYGDGEMFEPTEYLNVLQRAFASKPLEKDRYGVGGIVEALEQQFTKITGKEKAVFMPSGTMANQLAVSVLSGENSKVFVQDTSHFYRDEGDAAQSVFGKRLMPLAKGGTFFTAQQLQDAIEGLKEEEVFETGIGAVSIENPVRRTDGRSVPIDEIRKISAYCRDNNIKLHLDGARLYMASAWSGVSIQEYASYFDTVYISLYKYLGAGGGAILCGDKTTIDKMPHLIKVHGGSINGNWPNAAMALHRLEGFENRLQEAKKRGTEVFAALNRLPDITIKALPGGTNIYNLKLTPAIDGRKMQARLAKDFSIKIPIGNNNQSLITVNETLLYQGADFIIDAFQKSI